ncbi:MAG TPA: methyl-accepting chemotaxis protein [Methanospirillum sp.]|nr:methyl-accepting chemotaxis protein [Methanospirillum sp.]
MDAENSTRNASTFGSDSGEQSKIQEQILDTISLPLLLISGGRIIYGNAAASSFLKISCRDLRSMSLLELSPRLQTDGRHSEYAGEEGVRIALEGRPWSAPWIFKGPDGSILEAEITLTRIETQGKHLILASITDNSATKRQSQEIEKIRSEAQRRSDWYETILDAIKYPITVTDINRRWTFVNKAVEDMLKASRKDLLGHSCSEWGAGICNTADCGINRLNTGFQTTQFEQSGGHFTVDCAYLTDPSGRRIGHVEVVTDVTGMIRLIQYLKTEVDHLAKNLQKLAEGDLNLDYRVAEPDEYTREASRQFKSINTNLNKAVDAINLMMEDVMMLSESAISGVLGARADINRHKGDYTLVIQGINETLDAILRPLQEGIRVCDEYSKSNFSASFNYEIPVLGDFLKFRDSLNIIGDEISGVILNLKKEISSLSKYAENAITGVDDVSKGAREIAANAEETSQNAEKSEEGINQVLRAMSDLTTVVSDISSDADVVARLSEQANEQALQGTEHAGSADKGMKSITASSSEVERIITEIRKEMTQIRKIVNIITDLANQTNLLALNAAIEAARAGDAGRGFAVVAAEVKSLAQESRRSAESITDMIMGLERKSDAAASAIEAAGTAVKEGNRALSDTLTIFTELTGSVGKINSNMVNIAKATEHQAASFEEITASAHEMSSLVKKTADDATHSSATAEEAMALVAQITGIIDLINKAVDTMENEMNTFEVRK